MLQSSPENMPPLDIRQRAMAVSCYHTTWPVLLISRQLSFVWTTISVPPSPGSYLINWQKLALISWWNRLEKWHHPDGVQTVTRSYMSIAGGVLPRLRSKCSECHQHSEVVHNCSIWLTQWPMVESWRWAQFDKHVALANTHGKQTDTLM